MRKTTTELENVSNASNGGNEAIGMSEPYVMQVEIEGVSDLLFHRWNNEEVEAKSKAAKNSKAKKSDNIESYVYRTDKGNLGMPGEYLRQSLIGAARFRQDPRSPRKSASDLFKAAVQSLTTLADLGLREWNYLDKRRVVIQRNAVTRIRPALLAGWTAKFDLMVALPEYVDPHTLVDVLSSAGKLVGLADFRPTYGRYCVKNWQLQKQ